MGQVRLIGEGAAAALETLVPGDVQALGQGRMRYSLFTNEQGGILDDLMITNMGDHLFLVVNASCKEADIAHLRRHIGDRIAVEYLGERALLALQGPQAAEVLARFVPEAATMKFMSAIEADFRGVAVLITRSGYTGRTATRSRCPTCWPTPSPACCWPRPRSRRSAWGARLAPAGGGAVPLRPRHRHHDHPGRGRSELGDRKAPPRRGRFSRR